MACEPLDERRRHVRDGHRRAQPRDRVADGDGPFPQPQVQRAEAGVGSGHEDVDGGGQVRCGGGIAIRGRDQPVGSALHVRDLRRSWS